MAEGLGCILDMRHVGISLKEHVFRMVRCGDPQDCVQKDKTEVTDWLDFDCTFLIKVTQISAMRRNYLLHCDYVALVLGTTF